MHFARTIKGRSEKEGEKQRVSSHLGGTLKGLSNRRSNFSPPVPSKTTELQKQMISRDMLGV